MNNYKDNDNNNYKLASTDSGNSMEVSIVVPLYNEGPIVRKLHASIVSAMRNQNRDYEIVFVNDGSSDDTGPIAEEIAMNDDRVLFVDLRRNFGQTTALQAGIDHASGAIIITMDGDLQHDPFEIPFFLKEIDNGYDIVSGWRVRRRDNFVMRRIPSRVANLLLKYVSGVDLHDFGTTFKAYRREVLEGVHLYGDMHRFVPAVCARLGAKICEVPIKNIRRQAGKSNYGISRTFRVALDIIMLRFICNYLTQPLRFFGKWGMICMTLGGIILGYGGIRKLISWNSYSLFQEHAPLMAVGGLLVLSAMWLLSLGLIGEMLTRVYFETSHARTYAVGRKVRRPLAPHAIRT